MGQAKLDRSAQLATQRLAESMTEEIRNRREGGKFRKLLREGFIIEATDEHQRKTLTV